MSTIRVIAGSLKGRAIPFPRKKFINAEITPQKIKGALFSILGNLHGSTFLDLFSCSGQVGIEAVSRGAGLVVMNELDSLRFRYLEDFVKSLDLSGRVILLNLHAHAALAHCKKKGIHADCVFIDPPYPDKGEERFYSDIIREIDTNDVLAGDGAAIVQHQSGQAMAKEIGLFFLADLRKYGSNALTLYKKSARDAFI